MGYVYLAEFYDKPGVVKIGKTKEDNNTRLSQLVKSHGEIVNLRLWNCGDNYARAEKLCHSRFEDHRVRVSGDGGTEFFNGFADYKEARHCVESVVRDLCVANDPDFAHGIDESTYTYLIKDSRCIWDEDMRQVLYSIPFEVIPELYKVAVESSLKQAALESICWKYRRTIEPYFKLGSESFRMAVYLEDGQSLDYILQQFAKHHPDIPQRIVRFHFEHRDCSKRLKNVVDNIDKRAEESLRSFMTDEQFEDNYAWRLYMTLKTHANKVVKAYA